MELSSIARCALCEVLDASALKAHRGVRKSQLQGASEIKLALSYHRSSSVNQMGPHKITETDLKKKTNLI